MARVRVGGWAEASPRNAVVQDSRVKAAPIRLHLGLSSAARGAAPEARQRQAGEPLPVLRAIPPSRCPRPHPKPPPPPHQAPSHPSREHRASQPRQARKCRGAQKCRGAHLRSRRLYVTVSKSLSVFSTGTSTMAVRPSDSRMSRFTRRSCSSCSILQAAGGPAAAGAGAWAAAGYGAASRAGRQRRPALPQQHSRPGHLTGMQGERCADWWPSPRWHPSRAASCAAWSNLWRSPLPPCLPACGLP